MDEYTTTGTFIRSVGGFGGGEGKLLQPWGVAVDGEGHIWVTDRGENLLQEFSNTGEFLVQVGGGGSGNGKFEGPDQLTIDQERHIWVADSKNNRLEKLTIPPLSEEGPPEAPSVGESAVNTIDYGVPLEGKEAPQQMGIGKEGEPEPKKWGQLDVPAYATAIFPPDEAMGWPAKKYAHATVLYLDHEARIVNKATPSGAISTREYNETNNVVRSLSAANRAIALGEKEPAGAAKLLDTESTYSKDGTQLLEVLGPEHSVKLAGGSVVKARNHVKYAYDKGAPAGEVHDLVTEVVDGAEYEGKEADQRTTTTSYSGQENLGWKLRSPTSTTTDPGGLKLTQTTVYDPSSGAVLETRSPASRASGGGAGAEVASYGLTIGTKGALEEVKEPEGTAFDAAGNVWIADTANNRLEEYTSSGKYLGEVPCEAPGGLAIDKAGDLWVSEAAGQVVEFSASTHETLLAFASEGKETGQLNHPHGVAIDASGNVWVADTGNNRVEEYSSTGEYVGAIKAGYLGGLSGPEAVAIDSEGHVWVADTGYGLIEEFSPTSHSYLAFFGTPGKGTGQFLHPGGLTIDSTGHFWVADTGNNRVQEWPAAHKAVEATFGSEGSGAGQFKAPHGVSVDSLGDVWVSDTANHRIEETTGAGKYLGELGAGIIAEGALDAPAGTAVDGSGNIWVTDSAYNRVQEFSATGSFLQAFGSEGSGEGQLKSPHGIGIDKAGDVWVADTGNNRLEEFAPGGNYMSSIAAKAPYGLSISAAGNLWVTSTASSRIEEFSSAGALLFSFGSEGSGAGQLKAPQALARDTPGNIWVADTGNNRVEEFTVEGKYLTSFASEGSGEDQLKNPGGIAVDSAGNIWVADTGNSRLVEFAGKGEYLGKSGGLGSGSEQMSSPGGLVRSTAGNLYLADTANQRVQEWMPVTPDSHTTQVIYYTGESNLRIPECGGHPEWLGLPCQTQPAKQPETPGVPSLPVTRVTYNMYDQAETTTETFGETKRTHKTTFDAAGRPLTSETTGTSGQAVPAVTDTYDSTTGVLKEQSSTVEGTPHAIKTVYNPLGQLTSYTDAAEQATTYEYDIDGRATKVNTGRDQQTYGYEKETGELTELKDSQAGTFKAAYDVQGDMTSESYPNGMTASYARNAVGQITGLEYKKTTYCTEKCTWFTDSNTPSIHGETLTQTSPLAEESCQYDAAGRLTHVEEKPAEAGSACKNQGYTYDEDSNRTALTTYTNTKSGGCSTSEGSSTESHGYDTADRLTDTGISYDPYGDITKLPASDAGGQELTTEYYADSQVYQQSQAGISIQYKLDPEARTLETTAGTTKTVPHYAGPGSALAWTSESTGNTSCNIPGIDGAIAAIQTNTSTPLIQIHDLQGNIVATTEDKNENETKPSTLYQSTPFGVPTTTKPPKYSWLGAIGISSEIPTGTITKDGTTYIPQLGRGIQTQGTHPPIPTNAARTYNNPLPPWVAQSVAEAGAREHAAAEAARRAEQEANQPPGVIASPAPECNEEVEGCGPDPEHGANPWQCYIWVSWGHGFHLNEYLAVHGHWSCAEAPPDIEIEIGLLEVVGHEYRMVEASKHVYHYPAASCGTGACGDWSKGWTCDANHWYQAWVWGRTWDAWTNKTNWYATAEDGHWDQCPEGIDDPTQGPDQFTEA